MDASGTVGRECVAPAVGFVGVSMAFDAEPALDRVSLRVPAGRPRPRRAARDHPLGTVFAGGILDNPAI